MTRRFFHYSRLSFLLFTFGAAPLLTLSGCSPKEKTPRCLTCGMRADADPRFRAGGTLDGEEVFFDTPKCLFRLMESGKDVKNAWAVEYYTGERRPVDGLDFVVGSGVLGPMGDDLVPLSGDASTFLEDHGGRVLKRSEITKAVLDELH